MFLLLIKIASVCFLTLIESTIASIWYQNLSSLSIYSLQIHGSAIHKYARKIGSCEGSLQVLRDREKQIKQAMAALQGCELIAQFFCI